MAVKIKDLYEKLDSGNNGFKKIHSLELLYIIYWVVIFK